MGGEGDGEEVWNCTSPPSPLPLSSPGQDRQTQAELYTAVLAGALLQHDCSRLVVEKRVEVGLVDLSSCRVEFL